jgi:hypothetical protein
VLVSIEIIFALCNDFYCSTFTPSMQLLFSKNVEMFKIFFFSKNKILSRKIKNRLGYFLHYCKF